MEPRGLYGQESGARDLPCRGNRPEARRLQDSNYSSLPFVDVLFGTYHHPVDHPVAATGIEGDPVPAGLLAQVTYPFRALVEDARAPSLASNE